MASKLSPTRRLYIVIAISFSFFIAEISVGFYTHSLALIADAFHYLNDLVGFAIALAAILISKRSDAPKEFSFGWQRARLLGAFFNGVFLAALGLSIFLQSLERFISVQRVERPMLVLIIGAIGLTLNLISAVFLHEHGHGHEHSRNQTSTSESSPPANNSTTTTTDAIEFSFGTVGAGVHTSHRHVTTPGSARKGRDLGMLGVFLHVIGDAINNIGVMASAAAIWWGKTNARFYADPAVSMGISVMIFATSIPLIIGSGKILLESAPTGVDVAEIRKDLEELPGIASVHELHVWRLDQQKTIASVHVVTERISMDDFMEQAQQVGECLHAYGVHSFTVQPEQITRKAESQNTSIGATGHSSIHAHHAETAAGFKGLTCRIKCQEGVCAEPQCCD